METSSPKLYYPFLDGFRAVAILAVLTAHVTHYFQTATMSGVFFEVMTFLGPLGHMGVDVFFVISGFLITGILIPDFRNDIDVARFYKRRFFKIIPQFYVLLFFVIGLAQVLKACGLIENSCSFSKVIGYFAFAHNYYAQPIPFLAHTWSLAIEEHFYLVYPLVICLIFHFNKDDQRRRQLLSGFLMVFISGIVFFRDIVSPETLYSVVVNQTTLYRVDAIMFGCLLKLMEPHYSSGRVRFWVYFSPILLLLSFSIYYFFTTVFDDHDFIICKGKHLLAYLGPSFIFLGVYRGPRMIKALFENHQLIWIGRNSYGIYLWHYPLIYLFGLLVPRLGRIMTVVLYVAASLFVGFLSTLFIEKTFLKLRERISP